MIRKPAIVEIDNQRYMLTNVTIHQDFHGLTQLRAEIMDIFRESNARSRGKFNDIKEVIFNDPATIVIWSDGTKTVVKCQDGDTYSKEQGLAMCIAKKYLGNKGNFNEVFKKFIGDEYTHGEEEIDEDTMRKKLRLYCDHHGCENCPLDKVTVGRPGCYTGVSYELLKEHYKIVFGK